MSKLSRLLSSSTETVLPKIKQDLRRRLVLGGMAGAASLLATRGTLAQTPMPDRTVVSANGTIRTTLENYVHENGDEFRLMLITFPPGAASPAHRHPSVGHNYVLEGVAESQYEGEELKRFTAGQSYQDKANVTHAIFRNPDRTSPLKFLLTFTVKKDQPFLQVL